LCVYSLPSLVSFFFYLRQFELLCQSISISRILSFLFPHLFASAVFTSIPSKISFCFVASQALLYGPPGTGKSVSVFAWCLVTQAQSSVLFIRDPADLAGPFRVAYLHQNHLDFYSCPSFPSFPDLINAVSNSNPPSYLIVIYDGVRKKTLESQGLFLKQIGAINPSQIFLCLLSSEGVCSRIFFFPS
jgi:hypothetical protein